MLLLPLGCSFKKNDAARLSEAVSACGRRLINSERLMGGKWPEALKRFAQREGYLDTDNFYWAVLPNSYDSKVVGIYYSGEELFGTPYRVVGLDSKGEVRRSGSVTARQDYVPYCLIALKTSSSQIPKDYRGKWILGVGFVSRESKLESETKLCISATGHNLDISEGVKIYVEPVEWKDKSRFEFGAGRLVHVRMSNIKMRWVEIFPEASIQTHNGKRRLVSLEARK
jgi:hypothetical protein